MGRFGKGRSDSIHLKITNSILARLFEVEKETIRYWIRNKKLDPTRLDSIINLYNNRVEKKKTTTPV